MAAARVEPETVDEGALGFRLGPRINAAGRLYRADAGVELMLTRDPERAAAIAEELDQANSERRVTERRVADGAEAARSALAPEQAEAPALVLAGEGWHPGVVGIAASRLADRHWRPVVLLSLEGDVARGSARSIPGFDLIEALDACSEHLVRHGGHRAAAGLELRRSDVDAFRRDFVAHAAAAIDPGDLVQIERIDALVGVGREGIGMDLAEQLERLAPFGQGNPDPRLIVPSARLRTIRPMGQEGRHSRFDLESGAGRAMGVAFGINGDLDGREDEPLDVSVRLEVDRWNGAVQPRVVLRELYPLPDRAAGDGPRPGCADESCPAAAEEWWGRLGAELGRAAEGFPPALGRRTAGGRLARARGAPRGRRRSRRRGARLQRRVRAGPVRRRLPPPRAGRLGGRPAPLRSLRAAAGLLSLRRGGARRCAGTRSPGRGCGPRAGACRLGRAGAQAGRRHPLPPRGPDRSPAVRAARRARPRRAG